MYCTREQQIILFVYLQCNLRVRIIFLIKVRQSVRINFYFSRHMLKGISYAFLTLTGGNIIVYVICFISIECMWFDMNRWQYCVRDMFDMFHQQRGLTLILFVILQMLVQLEIAP